MEQKLELIQNERFGELECSIYHDKDSGEYLFTREQIGLALEYNDPRNSIMKIHARHADRLDQFSIKVPLDLREGQTVPPLSSGYGEQETVLYTRKGVFEICRWSHQPKADAFMDFVWEVTDRLISGEIALVSKDQVNAVPSAEINQKLGEMSAELRMMSNTLADHSVQLSNIGETVSKAEQAVSFSNYYLRTQMRSGYDENWKRRQNRNISAVSDFIGVDGKRLLQEIYKEMESRYGIDLSAFAKDYKRTKGLSACSTLSVISFSLTLREMFDAVIKEVMSICRLSPVEDSVANKSRIFTMAAETVVNHSDDLLET